MNYFTVDSTCVQFHFIMKSTVAIMVTTATIFLNIQSTVGLVYRGEYDIPAKDLAYLCTLINDYKKTGVKPHVADVTPNMPQSSYLNEKTKCWKMEWHACSPEEVGKVRPCGWYQMTNTDSSEC